MNIIGRAIVCTLFLFTCFSNAQAVSSFGAMTSGSYLDDASLNLISFEDGGVGSLNADIDDSPNLRAFASFDGPAFTPILKAKSESSDASSDDAFTQSGAGAYQTFTNTDVDPLAVTLDIMFDYVVTSDNTPLSSNFVLADVFVYGGSEFYVGNSSICNDGRLGESIFNGGAYFCGQRLGRANLSSSQNETMETLLFNVAPGESFGVYGILRANSRDGSANAFDTLSMAFDDITAQNVVAAGMPPTSAVPVPAAAWLFGTALLGMTGFTRRNRNKNNKL